jgi:hypothetical protein
MEDKTLTLIKSVTNCITCGSEVKINSGDEGTQSYAEQTTRLKAENKALMGALTGLIGLKAYKDLHGKDAHYKELQPKEWANARQVLNSIT